MGSRAKPVNGRTDARKLLRESSVALGSALERKTVRQRLGRLLAERLGVSRFSIQLAGDGDGSAREQRPAGSAAEQPGRESAFSVPLTVDDRRLGRLLLDSEQAAHFEPETIDLLHVLATQAAVAVRNADRFAAIQRQSVTDTVTGLLNRRGLMEHLTAEMARVQRFQLPLGLLMIDVDAFKQYNDHNGHLAGDRLLRRVAEEMQASIREVDRVGRFGGDEFCVVLPGSDTDDGLVVAHKLCRKIKALPGPDGLDGPVPRVSISVGVAACPQQCANPFRADALDNLIDAADRAAYEAKRRGRDQVISAAEVAPLP